MRICILQPSYIPWKGYFHQIQKADVFVFLDTVQYDKRGWRNRNQIKTPAGLRWLTIQVNAKGTHEGLKIQDVTVTSSNWLEGHLTALRQNYKGAPCFNQEFSAIASLLREAEGGSTRIARMTGELTMALASHIGITDTRFLYASELGIDSDDPTERLLRITQSLEGSVYLSGPSAKDYMNIALFHEAGIRIEWMSYGHYPEYPQLYPPFTHFVSILDMILTVGSKRVSELIWDVSPDL